MDSNCVKDSKYPHSDVVRFIHSLLTKDGVGKSQDVEDLMLGKGDYWFSVILRRRFIREGAQIMFNRERLHFCVLVNGKFYDASGEICGNGYGNWEDSPEFYDGKSIVRKNKIELM